MTIETFKHHISKDILKSKTERTIKTWYIIHCFICDNGECSHESAEDVVNILADEAGIKITVKTVMSNLRSMAEAKLLVSHPVILKHRGIFTGFRVFTTRFKIYTLPGFQPDFRS